MLAAEYRNAAFYIREYEPKDGKDGMVRIWSGQRPNFIYANINRVPMLIDLLKENGVLNGIPETNQLTLF